MLTGISPRFTLNNGAISFTSGETKAKDNLYFFMAFYATTRIYLRDFNPDTLWMLQKAVSYVSSISGLFVGKLRSAIINYVPSIKIQSINLVYSRATSPTYYGVAITYNYGTPTETSQAQTVTFI